MFARSFHHCLLACSATLLPAAAFAQPDIVQLPPVVVTATRTDTRSDDVPASIDRLDGEAVRAGRGQVNLSESLGTVPGVFARDRQNYAQDVQISVRGFGARSTFGIRGVRLYVDGIPATLPDGQGQITHVDLGTVGHIEVLRGPFSALYGNSSGGVIQVFTEEPAGPPCVRFGASAGSDDLLRFAAQASGTDGGFGYVLGASHFSTGGYRDHSAAERRLGNAKLTWQPDLESRWTLVVNSVALPRAQDPLGLNRAQFDANPRGADAAAEEFDTRKRMNQTQGGVVYERRIAADHTVRLLTYAGHRGTEQFQAIPTSAQANPMHPGGVIGLSRDYRGADARWTWKSQLVGGPIEWVGGVAWDDLDEHRQGFENFSGTTLGVRGALRRDEHNDVSNVDQYLQAAWQFAPRWALNAGVRHSRVRFSSTDAYVTGTNPDDTGHADYRATLPVAGLMYTPVESLHLYVTAGRGFETPTLNELAYRPGGESGMNFGLQASRSSSAEAGIKARLADWGAVTAAVFQTRTSNEIVTQTNSGGRATFQNAGATRRSGVELGWSNAWHRYLQAQVAATLLRARYQDGFATCSGTPCATPNLTIPAGNRIPGLAQGSWFASLGWLPPLGWRGGIEARYVTRVFANDANTQAAGSHAVVALHAGHVMQAGPWEVNGFIRIDNLLDRRHAGSVIVNEGNGRYFEPAPGRTWLTGVSGTLRF